jgi:DNA ligase 1
MMNKRQLLQRLAVGAALPYLLPALAQAAAPSGSPADPPALPLAQEWATGGDPSAYLVSEKLDGVRAFWDGRLLRFRGGGRIPAPGWFTAKLPPTPLDGELWLGRGRFDELSGLVRRELPDDAAWRQVRYMVFELPDAPGSFAERAARIEAIVARAAWTALVAVPQERVNSRDALDARLDGVLRAGGEGLVLHLASAPYQTGRSSALLKFKREHDAEAVVIAHKAGSGRLSGLTGALRVRTGDGVVFDVGSGLTDALRSNPPAVGSTITYRHSGLTPGGRPRFPTFVRVRDNGL